MLEAWFPVLFDVDLRADQLRRVTVFGVGFVLFRGPDDRPACLPDRCPHRAARLSDGRLVAGEIECLYHGWRFECGGSCVEIPQLGPSGSVPKGAHLAAVPVEVIDGLIWIYAGGVDGASPRAPVPAPISGMEDPRVHRIDFAMDLPYGHAALIENVLDFAHIHIAHDGVRGGGLRDHAGPLRFEVEDRGAAGFFATFLSEAKGGADGAPSPQATVHFDAPYLVHYLTRLGEDGGHARFTGLALYALPLDEDRCRLLYRAYGTEFPEEDVRRPRWQEHLHQMHLLEQDMAVVMGQVETLRREGRPLEKSWLPIKSSDPLVLRYAQWIDGHGRDVPGARGWMHAPSDPGSTEGKRVDRTSSDQRLDRWTLHTSTCESCRHAYGQLIQNAKARAIGALVCIILMWLLPWPLALLIAALGLLSGRSALRARQLAERLVADRLGDLPPRALPWA